MTDTRRPAVCGSDSFSFFIAIASASYFESLCVQLFCVLLFFPVLSQIFLICVVLAYSFFILQHHVFESCVCFDFDLI